MYKCIIIFIKPYIIRTNLKYSEKTGTQNISII